MNRSLTRMRLAFGAVALVVLLALAGCGGIVTPNACSVCGFDFEKSAEDHGADVSIEESELHIYLHEDGSAHWEAQATLEGDGVDELRSNVSMREDVVNEAFERNDGPEPDELRNLSIEMEGDTLVVGFDDPELAEPRAGDILLVDRFVDYEGGLGQSYSVRADRAVLHPPDGWAAVNDPQRATTTRNEIVWEERIPPTYVVVGHDRAPSTVAAGKLIVIREEGFRAAIPALVSSAIPALFLGTIGSGLLMGVDGVKLQKGRSVLDWELISVLLGTVLVLASIGFLTLLVPPSEFLSFRGILGGFAAVSVGLLGLAGAVAHRRPSLRWPPVVAATGLGVVLVVWLVYGSSPVPFLLVYFLLPLMFVWSLITAGLGTLAFGLGRWWVTRG